MSSLLAPSSLIHAGCDKPSLLDGTCVQPGLTTDSVDLGASNTTDVDTGGAPNGEPSAPGNETGGDETSTIDPTAITDTLGTCRSDRCGNTGTPSITLTDLASFSPTTPTIHMEPDGWALRGRPTNAIAQTTTNTHDGTLLGHTVTIRFTPTAYRWDWGDGTHDAFTTPGETWDDLGLPRFSETETSHTYSDRGTVAVSLAVDYTVAFRFGDGDWTTVEGTVSSATTADAYVGTAQTVNVPDDCNADSAAPGC